MKQKFIAVICLLLLCSCGKKSNFDSIKKEDIPHYEFVSNTSWESNTESCTYSLSFGEGLTFSNSCSCGNPVGASDVAESYRYDTKTNALTIIDCDGEQLEKGKIIYVDDHFLILDLWDETVVYENTKNPLPEPHEIAAEYVNLDERTKAQLSVLGFEDGVLTLSAYDYDGDAADNYKKFRLAADDDIEFTTVSVTIKGDDVSVEASTLTEDDYKNIGEFYHGGYVDIDSDGCIKSIVFYGELIIYE